MKKLKPVNKKAVLKKSLNKFLYKYQVITVKVIGYFLPMLYLVRLEKYKRTFLETNHGIVDQD
jgi:hypothetical protein